jgi:uncharacterized protein involved in exopolysaccharide biosynthesis
METSTMPPRALERIEAFPHYPEADSFDFRKSWEVLKHACRGHRLLIALTCILTVSIVGLYIKIWPPIFSAEVELAAEADKDTSREGFYQTWSIFRKENTSDEMELFTAGPILEEVVVTLGLTYDDVYHPFLSHAGYLWKKSWPGRMYRTAKDWLFPPQRGPYDPTPEQIEVARTVHDFKSGVKLAAIGETNVGKLVVRGPSPRVAEIANTMVQAYFDQRRNWHVQEADNSYRALQAELEIARKELADVEERMLRYHSENHLVLTFEKDKADITQRAALRIAIVDLQASMEAQEKSLAEVEADLAREEKEVVNTRTVAVNPVTDTLREKLSQLQLSRKQALIHFQPDAPEIKELDRQAANVNAQLAAVPSNTVRQTTVGLSNVYEALRARKAQLEADLAGQRAALAVKQEAAAKYKAEADTLPEKMKVVHDLDREHTALEKKYTALNDKLMMAVVSKATARSAPPPIRVIASANSPGEPDWPMSKLLLLLAAVTGLVTGVLLAMLWDFLYSRVNRDRLARAEPLYALVGQDRGFVDRLFPPPEPLAVADDGGSAGTGRRLGSRQH